MTSEEILSVLQDLADNEGDVLYDWDLDELSLLHELAKRLTDATREAIRTYPRWRDTPAHAF